MNIEDAKILFWTKEKDIISQSWKIIDIVKDLIVKPEYMSYLEKYYQV